MNGEYRDNIDNWADWEDYDESLDDAIRPVCAIDDFEARYNEHLRSIKSSSPRGVGRSTASHYYDEEDGLDDLLPTAEYLQRLARESGIDRDYNVHVAFRHAVEEMIRDDDTMASYFAMSQL